MLLERVTVLADGVKTSLKGEDTTTENADDEIRRLITVAVSQREAEKVASRRRPETCRSDC